MSNIPQIVSFWQTHRAQPLALATLVRVRGSSYRRPGARMLIAQDGRSAGSLSAGCIEEEVAAHARDVLQTRLPKLIAFDTRRRFGCNGSIEIFIEPAEETLLSEVGRHLAARQRCTLKTAFENHSPLGTSLGPGNNRQSDGAFIQTVEPPLRLLIIGSGPDSDALRAHAILLGWDAVLIAAITELALALDQRTAVVIATHNFGRDAAALRYLLPLGLPYVGLVGPRRRRDELLLDVVDSGATMLSGFFAPAGLHLAAEAPAEIALSIVAEIQTVFAEGTRAHLRDRKESIHANSVPVPALG